MRSAKRALLRLAGKPPKPSYAELVSVLDKQNRIIDDLHLIADAADDLIDAMHLLDVKGEPAVTIKTDDLELANTIAHRIWELEALLGGGTPPVPVAIERTIH